MIELISALMGSRLFKDGNQIGFSGEGGIRIDREIYFFWDLKPSVKYEMGDKIKRKALGESAHICFFIRGGNYENGYYREGDEDDDSFENHDFVEDNSFDDYDDEDPETWWPTPYIHAECGSYPEVSMYVPFEDRLFEIRPTWPKKYRATILENENQIGIVRISGLFRGKVICDLPDDVAIPVQFFICFAFRWRAAGLRTGKWYIIYSHDLRDVRKSLPIGFQPRQPDRAPGSLVGGGACGYFASANPSSSQDQKMHFVSFC